MAGRNINNADNNATVRRHGMNLSSPLIVSNRI